MLAIKLLIIEHYKVLCLVAIAIISDTALGVAKAITNNSFSFTSRGFKPFFTKCLIYGGFILFFTGVQWALSIPALVPACVIIIVNEAVSMRENVKDIPKLSGFINKIIDIIEEDE